MGGVRVAWPFAGAGDAAGDEAASAVGSACMGALVFSGETPTSDDVSDLTDAEGVRTLEGVAEGSEIRRESWVLSEGLFMVARALSGLRSNRPATRPALASRNGTLPLDPARMGGFAAVAFALPICSFNVAALAAAK